MNIFVALSLLAVVAIIGGQVLVVGLEVLTLELKDLARSRPLVALAIIFTGITIAWGAMFHDAVRKP